MDGQTTDGRQAHRYIPRTFRLRDKNDKTCTCMNNPGFSRSKKMRQRVVPRRVVFSRATGVEPVAVIIVWHAQFCIYFLLRGFHTLVKKPKRNTCKKQTIAHEKAKYKYML